MAKQPCGVNMKEHFRVTYTEEFCNGTGQSSILNAALKYIINIMCISGYAFKSLLLGQLHIDGHYYVVLREQAHLWRQYIVAGFGSK